MKPTIIRRLTSWLRQPQDPLVQIVDYWGAVRLINHKAWIGGAKYLQVYDPDSFQPLTQNGEPVLLHRENVVCAASSANDAKNGGVPLKSPRSN